MMFPSILEFLKQEAILIIPSCAVAILGVVLVLLVLRSQKIRRSPGLRSKCIIFAVACLLLGSIGLYRGLGALVSVVKWRAASLRICGMRVERIDREDRIAASPSVVVTNKDIVAAAFVFTQTPRARTRNHEHFLDGYRCQLLLDGDEDFSNVYLSVFRRSSRTSSVDVVIPHIGPTTIGPAKAGEYSSPSFHNWIREHIEPLFAEKTGGVHN